jgi:hypothetical protein
MTIDNAIAELRVELANLDKAITALDKYVACVSRKDTRTTRGPREPALQILLAPARKSRRFPSARRKLE